MTEYNLRKIMERAFSDYIGPGSDKIERIPFQEGLPSILIKYDIYSINDAGCGKRWIKDIIGNAIKYSSFDILPREEAEVLDITEEIMPKADLIICRDVLFHLTDKLVNKAIDNFRKSGKYLLATSCYNVTEARPKEFNGKVIESILDLIPIMGEPLTRIEEPALDRFMGLWKL